MIRALLIDDESHARADLRSALAAHPEIQVVGEAATIRAASELLRTADYDVVFLDIQIFGGSGFDLVPDVRAGARIIFVTAHNEFAVRAFDVNALDYLLKPVKPARLAAAVARLGEPVADTPPATAQFRADDTVHLNDGQRARFVRLADVSCITAEENYSRVQITDGTQMLVRRPLKSWETVLPSPFHRVHRTAIVNLVHTRAYERSGKSIELEVSGMSGRISVSRESTTDVKRRLDELFPR